MVRLRETGDIAALRLRETEDIAALRLRETGDKATFAEAERDWGHSNTS